MTTSVIKIDHEWQNHICSPKFPWELAITDSVYRLLVLMIDATGLDYPRHQYYWTSSYQPETWLSGQITITKDVYESSSQVKCDKKWVE